MPVVTEFVPRRPQTPSGAPDCNNVLSGVPSTLRIPLAARALGEALFPELQVGDAHAARMLEAMGEDGSCWLEDRASVYGILARTCIFRRLAQNFLTRYPSGHVVNLGCGLSHYFQWLDNGLARMTDADLPEVMAIRSRLLPTAARRHRMQVFDLTRGDWWEQLRLPRRRSDEPVFVLSEGVLMYLAPATVQTVLRTFGERAPPGSIFAFDAVCWLANGHAKMHPSVRLTDAEFRWGPHRLSDLTEPSPRLQLMGEHQVMEGFGWPFDWAWPIFRLTMGVPFYALYELHTTAGHAESRNDEAPASGAS